MAYLIVLAITLTLTGILHGQNPHAPNAPVEYEKQEFEKKEDDSKRTPASEDTLPNSNEDKSLPFYTNGIHLTPRVGNESTSYTQSNAPSLTQNSYRANVDVNWILPKSRYETDMRFSFSIFPITTNREDLHVRFFEANADLGYTLVKTSFIKLRLLGGIHYISMGVTDNELGIPNLFLPELYPSLTLYLFEGLVLEGSFRFLYTNTLFDNSQINVVKSLTASVFINHNHAISALLQENHFGLVSSGVRAQYYSLSLTMGYSF